MGITHGTRTDLTQGPILRSIVLFALPLLAGTLVQQLYNTVDMAIAGNFLGTQASAAIGASSLLVTCLVGLFGGLSVGSCVAAAQAFGAKDVRALRRIIHNTAALCLMGGILLAIVGYALSSWFLEAINTPGEVIADGVLYLRIYFISLLSVVSYNFGAALLRALGDSIHPLAAQLAGGCANVLADFALVVVFDCGIAGIAWATLVSQSVAAVYVVWRLTRLDDAYRLRLRAIAFDASVVRRVLAVGVPAGMQSLVITLSNVIAQSFINSLGTSSIAAFAAYFKVELIIYLPIMAFGQAAMTFVGQNAGVGAAGRVRRGTVCTAAVSMGVALATAAASLSAGGMLFAAFNPDPDVVALGCRLIGVSFPFYFLYSILQVFGDSMRGLGKAKIPMVIVVANICVIRTVLLMLIVPANPCIEAVGVTYPITWALTAVCMVSYYVWYHHRSREWERARLSPAAAECEVS